MRKALISFLMLGLYSCAGIQKVQIAKPCGVIEDGLKDVQAKTRDGNRRISNHYERGRGAGCWS